MLEAGEQGYHIPLASALSCIINQQSGLIQTEKLF